jgi:hypothetical protein
MNIWMDRIEQRVMVEYFFLKGHGSKLIHKELVSALQDNAISLLPVKNCFRRFKSGDVSCGDEERPGRPLISLDPALQRFLKKFSFASAQEMAGHFSADRATIKSILDRELGLRKFTGGRMPHILSAEQELRRVTESQSLLMIRANLAEKHFQGSFQGPEEILRAIQEARSHCIFEDFQNVFKSRMERLIWVIANNGEYCH